MTLQKLPCGGSNWDLMLWQSYIIISRYRKDLCCEAGCTICLDYRSSDCVRAWHFCHRLKDDVPRRPWGRECYRHPLKREKQPVAWYVRRASHCLTETQEGVVNTGCYMWVKSWKSQVSKRPHKYPGHMQHYVVKSSTFKRWVPLFYALLCVFNFLRQGPILFMYM
jgi:hypothetical protein